MNELTCKLPLTFSVLWLVAQSASSASASSIRGAIVSSGGGAISNATIAYQRIPVLSTDKLGRSVVMPGESTIGGAVHSDSKGNFTVSDIPAGTYRLCTGTEGRFLDACLWAPAMVLNVGSGSTSEPTIRLQAAVLFRLQVTNGGALLSNRPDGRMRAKFIAGVRTASGEFYAAEPNSALSVNGQLILEEAVPHGVPLSLWFFNPELKLINGQGKVIAGAPGTSTTFTVPPDVNLYTIAAAVTGIDR